MSTHHDTIRALIGTLVAGRYYPNKFPQETGAPSWPAIRGTIVTRDNAIDQCGAGEESEENVTMQLDICAPTYDAVSALLTSVSAALADAAAPWIRQPGGFDTWDAEAKVHRISRDWILYQSST